MSHSEWPEPDRLTVPVPTAPGADQAPDPGSYGGFRPAEFTPVGSPLEPAQEPSPVDPLFATRDETTGLPTAWPPPALPETKPLAVAAAPAGPSTLARIGEELMAWFRTLASAAVYATLIVTFGFQVARVEGLSMAPTLEDQDRLIVNKLAYRIADPRPGDIVMLYYPMDPSKSFVKRVIGEPGDTLRSVQGRVFRNDVPLADDFIPEDYRDNDTWGPEVVPDGHYFVMGDHRNNSSDSRTWKWVPRRYIIGKVQIRWWPLNHARVF